MGTPAFAVPSLDALLGVADVLAVYTRPDGASGRGRRVAFSPVKERALEVGLSVEQPPTLRDGSVTDRLAAYGPDLVVVAAYGLILPRAVLDVPTSGCINVHASLLPRWRGAAPVQRAILAGDRICGVSIMRMEEGLDTGPYAVQATVPVGDRTTDELTAELAHAGAGALVRALGAIEAGTVVWTEQDDALATYANKVSADDLALQPGLGVEEALRRVRASSRSAPCRVAVGGRRAVVLRASQADADLAPAAASCDRDVLLGMADGVVRIDELVPQGRSAMSGDAFARGARLDATCTWETA
jgi:methionyl-tRNA formyltransferase